MKQKMKFEIADIWSLSELLKILAN